MANISSIMKTDIMTAEPTEKVSSVAYNMAMNDIGAAIVLENGQITGIFSERDLLKRVIGEERDLNETRVDEVATKEVITATVETSLKQCAQILKENNIRHLPIVDSEKKPVGIVSSRDFFRRLNDSFEKFIEQAQYEEALESGVDPYDHMGGEFDK